MMEAAACAAAELPYVRVRERRVYVSGACT